VTTKKTYYYGTGKRKSAIARVKIFDTNGKIQVNGKSIKYNDDINLPIEELEEAHKYWLNKYMDN